MKVKKTERNLRRYSRWYGGTDSLWAKKLYPERGIEWLAWQCYVEKRKGWTLQNLILARLPKNPLNWLGWQMAKSKTRILGPVNQNGLKGWAMRWEWDLSSLAPMRLHSITAVFIWLRYGMVDGKSGHNSSTPCIHAPCNVNLQLLSPRDRIYTYNLLNLC